VVNSVIIVKHIKNNKIYEYFIFRKGLCSVVVLLLLFF
jgi:hypothetical protein